jgi:hypothetical protein
MKVFNLCCAHEHSFEGWFASTEAFSSQLERGLVECPLCGDRTIRRLPTAPRLNLSARHAPEGEAAVRGADAPAAAAAPTPEQLQALWLRLARQIRDHTEDVGKRFAEEARRIHYREAPERGIRGVTTPEEATSLAEEGIEVFSFPMPKGLDGPVQ